jgi:hypothetical protein
VTTSRTTSIIALCAAALATGAVITWIDTRPTWDDAGVSAGMLLISGGLFGAVEPRRPWLWGLLIGAGIPLLGILRSGNGAALLALGFAVVGAYAGALVRKSIDPQGKTSRS